MKRTYFTILFYCIVATIFTQQHQLRKDTVTVGHLIDTTVKAKNLYTEISFGLPGGAFTTQPDSGFLDGRSFALTFQTNFRIGYYPINRLLVGWTFTPYITFSNWGLEGFRWSTGPFIRYYLPFYRVNKKKELKSPFALYFFFEARFGQYNPVVLGASYDARVVGGFSAGIGFQFKLNKNLQLNLQLGPGYDFFSPEFAVSNFNFNLSVGLNYSFPTKRDRQEKKLNKFKSRSGY